MCPNVRCKILAHDRVLDNAVVKEVGIHNIHGDVRPELGRYGPVASLAGNLGRFLDYLGFPRNFFSGLTVTLIDLPEFYRWQYDPSSHNLYLNLGRREDKFLILEGYSDPFQVFAEYHLLLPYVSEIPTALDRLLTPGSTHLDAVMNYAFRVAFYQCHQDRVFYTRHARENPAVLAIYRAFQNGLPAQDIHTQLEHTGESLFGRFFKEGYYPIIEGLRAWETNSLNPYYSEHIKGYLLSSEMRDLYGRAIGDLMGTVTDFCGRVVPVRHGPTDRAPLKEKSAVLKSVS